MTDYISIFIMPFLAYVYFVSMCKLKPVPNLRFKFYFCLFEFKRHRPGHAKIALHHVLYSARCVLTI